MRSTHLRRSAAALALTVSGALLFAGTAMAADTTIVVKSDDGVVFADQPLELSGTCAAGSTTAVVSFEQDGDVVAEEPIDLDQDGSWGTKLDISDAIDGPATANVDCFAYGTADAVGSASEEVFVSPDRHPGLRGHRLTVQGPHRSLLHPDGALPGRHRGRLRRRGRGGRRRAVPVQDGHPGRRRHRLLHGEDPDQGRQRRPGLRHHRVRYRCHLRVRHGDARRRRSHRVRLR